MNLLSKIDHFHKLCLATLNPFEKPLKQRNWDENIGDYHVWNVMLNEVPILLDMKNNEQALSEWTDALQLRLGVPPKYFSDIKKIIENYGSKI